MDGDERVSKRSEIFLTYKTKERQEPSDKPSFIYLFSTRRFYLVPIDHYFNFWEAKSSQYLSLRKSFS